MTDEISDHVKFNLNSLVNDGYHFNDVRFKYVNQWTYLLMQLTEAKKSLELLKNSENGELDSVYLKQALFRSYVISYAKSFSSSGKGRITLNKKEIFKEQKEKHYGKDKYIKFYHQPSDLNKEYPVPEWTTESAINAIILDYYISQFDLAAMTNNLSLSHVINVPLARPKNGRKDELTRYEKRKALIQESIKVKGQGASNANNFLILFSDPTSGGKGMQIAAIPNNNNSKTLQDKESRKDRVLVRAFGATHPAILGGQTESGSNLGSSTGILTEAENLFYTTVIESKIQVAKVFLNDDLIPLYKALTGEGDESLQCDFPRNIRWKYTPSDAIMLATFTTGEIRDRFQVKGEYTDKIREILIRDLADRKEAGGGNDTINNSERTPLKDEDIANNRNLKEEGKDEKEEKD